MNNDNQIKAFKKKFITNIRADAIPLKDPTIQSNMLNYFGWPLIQFYLNKNFFVTLDAIKDKEKCL